MRRMCVGTVVFYPTISQWSCHVQHYTCSQNVAVHPMFNIQEFQAAYSMIFFTVRKCILHGKVHIVFLQFALTLHWMRDKTKVFYPTIYQRSCHVPHSTFSQKNKINIFNIQEFQAAFSTLYCTVGKCILHRKSAYSVRLHYKECSLKIRCFIREYLSDPYF